MYISIPFQYMSFFEHPTHNIQYHKSWRQMIDISIQ
jgi:hypothetical protein